MNPSIERLRTKLEVDPPGWAGRNLILVALGDSVTAGLGINPVMIGNDVYHEQFRRDLIAAYSKRGFSTINAGIGGDTTRGALVRLQSDVLDHHPDLVVVCYGLNDCGAGARGEETFRRNLAEIVARIEERAAVILLTPNMMATRDHVGVDPNYKKHIHEFVRQQTDGTLDRYVDIIREVAAAAPVPLADGYAEWKRRQAAGEDTTSWLVNGFNHPDARGHRILADVLWKTFATAVGR